MLAVPTDAQRNALHEFNYPERGEGEECAARDRNDDAAAARELDKHRIGRVTRLAALNYEARQVRPAPTAARSGPPRRR
jgi:hypothetical protein